MARRRSSGITSLAFNQDQGCFSCCLMTGLRIYNVDPLVEKSHYTKEDLGEVSLCEMVYRTNWLLVVRARDPRTLVLLDDAGRSTLAEITFKAPIGALRARRDKVAVSLPTSVQVLSLPSLSRAALVRTPVRAPPLLALATEPRAAPLLAALAHRRGSVQLLDVSKSVQSTISSSPSVLGCHRTDLVCLSLSADGCRLATASRRGTIIRVWDTAAKSMLHELRRGTDYADVYCINFSASKRLVCCVSDTGTLHVWKTRGGRIAAVGSRCTSAPARALCAFHGEDAAVVISTDGTFNKFKFSDEGACHRSEFEHFLQVGDDEEFL